MRSRLVPPITLLLAGACSALSAERTVPEGRAVDSAQDEQNAVVVSIRPSGAAQLDGVVALVEDRDGVEVTVWLSGLDPVSLPTIYLYQESDCRDVDPSRSEGSELGAVEVRPSGRAWFAGLIDGAKLNGGTGRSALVVTEAQGPEIRHSGRNDELGCIEVPI